jgi:hypothetical protein
LVPPSKALGPQLFLPHLRLPHFPTFPSPPSWLTTMRATLRLRNASALAGKTIRPSAALIERVRRPAFLNKLTTAEDLAPQFKVSALPDSHGEPASTDKPPLGRMMTTFVPLSHSISIGGVFNASIQIGWSGFTGVGYPKMTPTVRAASCFPFSLTHFSDYTRLGNRGPYRIE